MQWYECWHSEGVAPQFTKPLLFSLKEMGGYYYTIGMLMPCNAQKTGMYCPGTPTHLLFISSFLAHVMSALVSMHSVNVSWL